MAAKIIRSLLLTAGVLFVGLWGVLVTAVFAARAFPLILTVAAIAAVWLLAILRIWKLLKPPALKAAAGIAFALLALSAAGYGAAQAYRAGIDEVSESGVDLSRYAPFREDTLAASLDGPSALQISEDFPRLDGATALYPLYAAFARAVYPEGYDGSLPEDRAAATGAIVPEKAVGIVACTNTEGAYRRLITGDADVIFAAGPSAEQLAMAEKMNVELKLTPIGREAFVFFVNAANPVGGLSIEDVRRIYSGEATAWREFGGGRSRIRAYQRQENSGSQTALVHFMGDTPVMTPPKEDIVSAMDGIISRVSSYKNYRNAIGYSFLYYVTEMAKDNKIRLLAIEGVAPSRENVENGTYPFASAFYAVTAGTANPNAGRLIQWILSDQGRYLIEKTGYTPLRR